MAEHPIQGLMDTAMSNIKAMVDVDTIVGNAVTAPDNTVIIPISTVSFGFAAGGSEIPGKKANVTDGQDALFGGGAGGGANVKPVAFLVVGGGNVRLLPITETSSPVDKLIDLMPEMVDKVNGAVSSMKKKKEEKKETVEE
ncbi:MAG: GerW family sporulation protein [Clostridia bacterium]|nr:GerW family sporulation protein [Clostridia bacterium]